jgi:uncharacterized hydrophobic protein (TIGR00271 family)
MSIPDPGSHPARAAEARIHVVALRLLDLTPRDRSDVLERMFVRRRRDLVSYWLQLLLSVAIATVGLVLGSTAVVIGAMLIAPLMGPIVELGMGLVAGSPVLTLRSFGRMAGSVLAGIAGAALLTVLLPFQEITAEISTRTSPTALDLLLAVFVAVAAAFTTARPGSETTSAAAGTAIGIALVPPVCVIGFGLGIGDLHVTRGATLLFLTNLTAILFVSVLFFWTLGFETLDTTAWEDEALARARPDGWTRRGVRALRALFGSRYSRALRVGLPLLLVAAVFVPLRRALEQVAWEVRARSAVSRILDRTLEGSSAVQSQVSVAPGAVTVRLYVVGTVEDAARMERDLANRIAAATGIVPAVRIVSVPDSEAMRQAAGTREEAAAATRPAVDLATLRGRVGAAVRDAWPAPQLGPLLAWRLEVPDSAAPRLTLQHLGAPAGAAADALLARSISRGSGTELEVRTVAYPPGPFAAPAAEGEAWLPEFARVLGAVGESRVFACVQVPDTVAAQGNAGIREVAATVRAQAARQPAGRAVVTAGGDAWSVRLSPRPCAAPAAPPGDSAAAAP